GQIISYREVNANSNPIVYNFNGANELSLVKNDHMTLVLQATDPSGNTATASTSAVIPCTNLPVEEGEPLVELQQLKEDAILVDGLEVYPNPSANRAFIQFELTHAQAVTCRVLDINGRVIDILFEGDLEAGIQQMTWQATTMPAGIYLVQLQTKGDLQMQKIQIAH
ncbi:MAG: T9SS type A sorting domain-containing protein, partial [Bacteroidota bacterium]